ncbi:MAG TPA: TAXI family TRAP transporter solute-binding subunit [Xanthobacteraceae bacterium]|nr:TAXI family TRAP transporter solute-binding subunit [Xanthobacteraceae bacterium]
MLRSIVARTTIAVAGATLLLSSAVRADDVKLPSSLTFTAYDTGSSGFNIAVAVGKMMKEKYNSNVRVLPAGNDVARLAPLRAGRAVASAMGTGSYFAQEGVFEFGVKEWGPQPIQLLLSTVDCNGLSVGIANDIGVKDLKDFKGKRLGFVVGSPALNQNALAIIAFAGLTKNDVKIVEFASYGAMWKGIINNDADGAFASTISGQAKEAETSPRGLMWPTMAKDDKAGWERVQKVGPFFTPHTVSCGAGISKDKPIEMGTYPYPLFVAYGTEPVDSIYPIVKAMIDGYDGYKDGAPGAVGLELKRQTMKWVVPFHPGTVKAMKEAGHWTAEDQAHNDALIKRQGILAAAWTAFVKTNPPDDKFSEGWAAARKEALARANLPDAFN